MPLYEPTKEDKAVAGSTIPAVSGMFTETSISSVESDQTIKPTLTEESIKSDFYTSPLESVIEGEAARKAEVQRRVNVRDTPFDMKLSSMWEAFGDNTLSHVIEWVKIDMAPGDVDKEFVQTLDKEFIEEVMRQNGLTSPKSYNDLIESKNSQQFYAKLNLAMEREASNKEIENTLTRFENIGASIAGEVLTDPTLLLTGVIGLSTKSTRLMSALSSARKSSISAVAGSEIAYGQLVAMSDDDFDAIDALIFYSFPAAFDSYLLGKSLKKLDGSIVSKFDDAPSIKSIDSIAEGEYLPATVGNKAEVTKEKVIDGKIEAYKSDMERLNKKLETLSDELSKLPKTDKKGKNPKWLEKRTEIKNIEDEIKLLDDKVKTLSKTTGAKEIIENSKALKWARRRKATTKKIESILKSIENRRAAPYYKTKKVLSEAEHAVVSKIVLKDSVELSRELSALVDDVKNISIPSSKKIEYMENIGDFMHSTGMLSNNAYKRLKRSLKSGKLENLPKVDVKLSKDGKGTDVFVNGKKINRFPIAMGLALSGTGLFAGENETLNDIFNSIPATIAFTIAAMLFGVPLVNRLRATGLKGIAEKAGAIASKAKAMDKTIPIRVKIENGMNAVRTQFTETVEPVKKATSGRLRKFADTLYYDPINNSGGSIERAKAIFVRRYFNTYLKETNDIFFKWLESTGKTKMDYIISIFSNNSLKDQFKTMVTKYRTEGKFSDVPEVVAASKIVDDHFDAMAREFIENGVKGAEKLKNGGIANYVPRLMRVDELRALLAYATPESKANFIDNFSEMLSMKYNKEQRMEIASIYLESMLDSTFAMNLARKDKSRILKGLIDRGIDKEIAEDIVNSMMGEASRLKFRMQMDYTKFKPTEIINEDGSISKITIDDIFEQNMDNIMSRYINMMGGHNALAVHGFESLDEALQEVIHGAGKQWAKNVIMQDLLTIVGHPSVDYTNIANVAARGASNTAIGAKMLLSTISMMSEMFIYASYVLKNNGVFDGMKKLSHTITNNFGEDAFITKAQAFGKDGMGIGTHRYTGSFGQMKKFDEVGNIDSQIGGKMLKGTEIMRDFTLFGLPFVKTSDFLQRANLQDILDTLYYHLKSDKKVLNAYELDVIPNISDELKSYLKGSMQLNKKNHVKWFDLDKMPLSLKNEFREMVDAMLLKRMNETTMGTSAPFSRHTAIGIAFMPMLKYGMTAFSNLGIYDMRGALRGDFHAVMRTMLWFQAGMLQTHMRHAIQGKEEPDAETLIINGMLNMPMLGAYSLFTSMGDSPTEQMIRETVNLVDLYEMTR